MAKPLKYKKVITDSVADKKEEYPEFIRFESDGSELKFEEARTVDGKKMIYYRYTKSIEKLGMVLPVLDIHLKGLVNNQFCKPIKF